MGASTPTVAIARELLPAGLELLEAERLSIRSGGLEAGPGEWLELVAGCDALVADLTVPVGEDLLEAAGDQLRIVANFAVGHDNVDLKACRRRGIAVTNTPGALTNATAELALTLTFAAARRAGEAERALRAGLWTGWDPGAYLGLELSGATFGIVGLGRIGGRYAELVRPLAGRLLYAARSPKPAAEAELGAERSELDELLASSDVVSLHAPGGPETAGMIGSRQLALMRADAVLVNTGRGSLVDSAALAEALSAGELGAAGLDVYEDEPAVPAELRAAPRCVLLPHIGSATTSARSAMARMVAGDVLAVLDGREPEHRVA